MFDKTVCLIYFSYCNFTVEISFWNSYLLYKQTAQ